MIFNQSPCTFVKNKKMVHYDKVSIDLVKLKNFKRPADWNSYTEVLFSEDWITRKDLDWNAYLITLLDHVQDLKKHYLPIIDLEFEESDDFFDQCSKFPKEVTLKYNLKESYIAQSAEEETKLEEWDFSRHHLILIENLEMDIQKCFEFFEKNKDLPPFLEKVLSLNKIPFFGNQAEFSFLFYLFIESGIIPMISKLPSLNKLNLYTEDANGKKAFKLPSKQNVIKQITEGFYSLILEDDTDGKQTKVKEEEFKTNSVYKSINTSSAGDLKLHEIIKIENILNELLKSVKLVKEFNIEKEKNSNKKLSKAIKN